MSQDLTNLKIWCAKPPIGLCVLFGSRAVNRARADSDYDLAFRTTVVLAPLERVRWQAILEDILNSDASIVFLTAHTDPVLGWEIVRAGQLMYEAQPGMWASERLRLWHSYNATLPFRRGLAESLRRYAEDVRRAS